MRLRTSVKLKLFVTVAGLGLAATAPILAHHSFAAEFDRDKLIRLEGILTKIEWMNPHSYFYLDVKDKEGKVVNWGCQAANPAALLRRGFKRDGIKLGDKLIVDGYAAKDGTHLINARRVHLRDGRLFFLSNEDDGGPGDHGQE